MKPKLSVLMPAKRTERWLGLWESITESFSGSFELLISTKMEIPENMKNIDNASFTFSERSPLHKQQELLTMAKGEYVTAISDDTLFQPDAINRTFEILEKKENKGKFAVCKYLEGKEIRFEPFYGPDAGPHLLYDMQPPQQGRNDNRHTWYFTPRYRTNYDFMRSDEHYLCKTHNSSNMKYVHPRAPILSNAIFPHNLIVGFGGWDCRWESVPMANNDLACRLMCAGLDYIMSPVVTQICGYMEHGSGDHGALHEAALADAVIFKEMYEKPEAIERRSINLMNFKNTPEVWARRANHVDNPI